MFIVCFSWKREQFERFEAQGAAKPMSQISESEEIPDIECFQGTEDLLAAKLGTHVLKLYSRHCTCERTNPHTTAFYIDYIASLIFVGYSFSWSTKS